MIDNSPIAFDDHHMIVQEDIGKIVNKYYMTPLLDADGVSHKACNHNKEDVSKNMLITTQSVFKTNDIMKGTKGFHSRKYVELISKS